MAQQTINVGTAPNDGTGTPLRTAFQYTNSNFSELYTAVGPSGNNIVCPGSATISGDLTVRSGNKLKLFRSDNAISTDFSDGGSGVGTIINNLNIDGFRLRLGGNNVYNVAGDGTYTQTWFNGAGGTWMTLNATGLGVGASPSYQLHVAKAQSSQTAIYVDNQQNNAAASSALTLSAYGGFWNLSVPHSATFVNPLIFKFGSTEMMRLDASGNVGIGVTPSAWNTAYAVAQVGIGGSIWSLKSTYYDQFGLGCNHFENTSGADRYVNNGRASQYFQYQGTHIFRIAGNNTSGANQPLTWTPAMTLDASGNLILLSSNTPATLTTNGQLTVNATSNTNLRFSYRGSDGVTRVANITLA